MGLKVGCFIGYWFFYLPGKNLPTSVQKPGSEMSYPFSNYNETTKHKHTSIGSYMAPQWSKE